MTATPLILFIFFLFGVGGWMAWNAALTGLDFYDSRFKPVGKDPGFVFGFVFNWPLFAFNVALLYLTTKISLGIRIYVSFVFIIVCSFSMPFITEYIPPNAAWWILLASIVINGAASAFAQGGLFGFVSVFPTNCVSYLLVGQGMSGVILNVIKIIFLVVLPPDESKGPNDMNSYYDSIIFLSVAVVILLLCMVGYWYLLGLDFTKYYALRSQVREDSFDSYAPIVTQVDDENEALIDSYQNAKKSTVTSMRHKINRTQHDMSTIMTAPEAVEIDPIVCKTLLCILYKKIFMIAIQATMVFGFTFLIYPGTLLSTKFDMLDGNKSAKSWFNIIMITIFSLGDTIGRSLAGKWRLLGPKTVMFLTIGRTLFIVTAILIQLASPPSWLFQSDWFRILNMLIFAITNGYNCTLVMMYGPQSVGALDKETAGVIMNFHLIGGVCVGAIIAAFVMNQIPTH